MAETAFVPRIDHSSGLGLHLHIVDGWQTGRAANR